MSWGSFALRNSVLTQGFKYSYLRSLGGLAANERDVVLKKCGIVAKFVHVIKIGSGI